MGFKTYERWSAADWRRAAETVEAMIAQGWRLRTRCGRCQTVLRGNLYQVAAARGPRFSLWNRTTACRVADCHGRAEFWAMPRESTAWVRLNAALAPGSPHAGGASPDPPP